MPTPLPEVTEETFHRLIRVVERLDKAVESLTTALTGEPELGHVGLVPRISELELRLTTTEQQYREGLQRVHERIDEVRTAVQRIMWVAAGAAAATAGGTVGMIRLIASG